MNAVAVAKKAEWLGRAADIIVPPEYATTDRICQRWAVSIGRLQDGRITDDWQPPYALAMATREGARAMGLEQEIGALTVGRKADLVVVDSRRAHLTPATSALGNLIHVAQGRDVEHVIVDGRVVVEGGRATQVDEEQIRRDAARVTRDLWARARK